MNTIMKAYRPLVNTYPSMFDGLFNESPSFKNERTVNFPAVNVLETDGNFKIEIAVPGLKKEQIKVNVEKQTLTISSETKEEEINNYTRKEFSYQTFSRSFQLPKSVDLDKIEAFYEEGILSLVLAKKEEALPKEPRVIEIA
jgi:HSP20 family protein